MIGRWAVLVFVALIGAAQAQSISGGGAGSLPPVTEGGCLIGTGGVWVGGACSGSGTPVTSVTGTANKITASPTTGAVVLTLPAAVTVATSFSVGTPTGTPSTGDINISGDFKKNGAVIGGVGTVTGTVNQITASPTSGAVVLSLPASVTVDSSLKVGTPTGAVSAGDVNISGLFKINGTSAIPAGPFVNTVTGTANQIAASPSSGAVVLSLPASVALTTSLSVGTPTGSPSTGDINISGAFKINGTAIGGVNSVAGTTNQITATPTTGAVVLSLPASVALTTALTVGGPTGATSAGDVNISGAFKVNGVAITSGVNSVSGTANQITATPTTGAVVLSLPAALQLTTSLAVGAPTGTTSAGDVNVAGAVKVNGTSVITAVTGTANQITATPTGGAVALSLPAAVQLTTSLAVGAPTGTTSAGDVNIAGLFKVNGTSIAITPSTNLTINALTVTTLGGSGARCLHADNTGIVSIASSDCATGGSGSVQSVTLGAGFTTTVGTQNTGTQQITISGTINQQLWPVDQATSYSVQSADTGNMLIATGGSVTFTLPNPAAGTKGRRFPFASNGLQGYTLTTVGGTALVYGCAGAGTASVLFPANVDVVVVDTGTAYKCSGVGASIGGGGGTVNNGSGPAIAQYPAGPGSTVVGPVTISGDAQIAQGGALTIQGGAIGNTKLTSMLPNTMKGNWTALNAQPADNAMPTCVDTGGQHLNYVAGTGITCGTSAVTAPVTSVSGTATQITASPTTGAVVLSLPAAVTLASSLTVGIPSGTASAGDINIAGLFKINGVSVVNTVTGTANQITASPTSGAVVLSLPAALAVTTSIAVNSPTGTTSAGDINISGQFKQNGTPITSGGGGTGTINSGTGPAIAQYVAGTGIVVGPATISGDLAIAQGGAATIQPQTITNAKLFTVGANTLKGNWSNTAGTAPQDNVVPQCLDTGSNHLNYINGTGLVCGTAVPSIPTTSLTGTLQAAQEPAHTGDVTNTAGSLALAIAPGAVTSAQFRQGIARSVVGVTGNATASVGDIQGAANQVLVINSAGTALAFGQVNLASSAAVTGALMASSFPALTGQVTTTAGSLATTIATNTVTNANLRQGAARSVIGVIGNATANVADIAGTTDQVLRVTSAGTGLGFGPINMGTTAAVSGYDTSLLSTTGGSFSSKEPCALTEVATIVVDLGCSHVLTITETVNGRLYANPTNGKLGDTYLFKRTVSGTGISPTFGASWFFQNGGASPNLSTSSAKDLIGCVVGAVAGSNVTEFYCNVLGLNYAGGFNPFSLSNVQVVLDPSDHSTTFANGTCTSSTVSTDGAAVGSIRDLSTNGSCWVATGGTITLHTDGTSWWLTNNGSSSLVAATGTGANPNTIAQAKGVVAAVMGVQYASNVASKLMLNIRGNTNNPRMVCGLNTNGGTANGPSASVRRLDADATVTVSPGTAAGYTGVPLAQECNATFGTGNVWMWTNNGPIFSNSTTTGNTDNTVSSPSPSALVTASSSDRLYYLLVWTPTVNPGPEQDQLQTYVCHKMGITC